MKRQGVRPSRVSEWRPSAVGTALGIQISSSPNDFDVYEGDGAGKMKRFTNEPSFENDMTEQLIIRDKSDRTHQSKLPSRASRHQNRKRSTNRQLLSTARFLNSHGLRADC